MKTISLPLAIALAIVTGTIGIGIGYALTPEYQLSMYDKNAMDLGAADRWVDQRYLNAMIAHHRGAILMAEQAQASERPQVRELAAEILENEPKLIAELYAWKEEWYGDTRSVRDPLAPKFGPVDETFDLRFLNALIAHHESGVEMAKEIRLKSSRSEVLNNADDVEAFLITSGGTLRSWRSDWYGI